jgi:hypothetical protein
MIRNGALILAFVFVAACGGDDEGPAAGTGGAGGLGGTGGMGGMGGSSGLGGAGGMGGIGGGGIGGGGIGGGGIGGGGIGGGGIGGGGAGGMMEMDDDAGMMEMDEDSGVEEPEVDAGTDAGGNTVEEGAQNGPCRESGDACDDGLGCYAPDENLPNFCTLECTENGDCAALGGATWTCWVMEGLCRVQCDRNNGNNGNDDCPADFECTDVLGQDRCVPIE